MFSFVHISGQTVNLTHTDINVFLVSLSAFAKYDELDESQIREENLKQSEAAIELDEGQFSNDIP